MYQKSFTITQPIWNNQFNYDKRIQLWSPAQIYIPSLIHWTIEDIQISDQIAFEEVENDKIISCYWLKNLVKINHKGIPITIIDNHNHALYFRQQQFKTKPLNYQLIHIDQHSDMQDNPHQINPNSSDQEFFEFTNYMCNVWNFIKPALDNWLIKDIIQIRTQTALKNLENFKAKHPIILDIDIDFRVSKSQEDKKSDFKIIRQLINQADLVTIATSPFFIDQNLAIEIINDLFK